MRISYQTHENAEWTFGKTWILHGSLEGGEIEFITDWMRPK